MEAWLALRLDLGEQLPGLKWDWGRARHIGSDDSVYFLPRWVWFSGGVSEFLPK